jgi:lysine/ornithine N-monooxygenase
MGEKILLSFFQSDLFWTLAFIGVGFLVSALVRKLKAYFEKTPSQLDDAVFNFLVNDIFLKVEKNKLDEFMNKFGIDFAGKNKVETAIDIFQRCYKETTGKDANMTILTQAKAVWSQLALQNPSPQKSN